MKDWLNEWYNDQFNQIDLTPSSKVWDNIAQSMEEWPKHWYASNAEDVRTQPRPSTWEQLNQQLVRERSIQRANRVPYIAASIMAAILMFVPLNTDDSIVSRASDIEVTQFDKAYSDLNDQLVHNSIEDRASFSNQVNQDVFADRVDDVTNSGNENDTPISSIPNKYQQSFIHHEFENGHIALSNKAIRISLAERPVRSLKTPDFNARENISPYGKQFVRNKLSFSLNPQISMLNNPITQKAISSDEQRLSIRPDIALELAYQRNFNKRSGLKLAVLFNNNKTLLSASNTSEREISLNYSSLGALYTTQWDFLKSDRLNFQTEAGLIASYASDPVVRFNEERVQYLESGFSRFDLGVIVGASLETKLTSKWSLTTGIQSQVGMLNIFEGNEFVPKDYFSTSTQSAGLSFGLIRKF